jgi:hypothetical protein
MIGAAVQYIAKQTEHPRTVVPRGSHMRLPVIASFAAATRAILHLR